MITKDSNVICVALAGNIVTGLAKGLRKGFQNYASFVSSFNLISLQRTVVTKLLSLACCRIPGPSVFLINVEKLGVAWG